MQISKDEMNFRFTGKGCHCTLKTPVIYIEIVPFIITFYLMSTFYLCILRLKTYKVNVINWFPATIINPDKYSVLWNSQIKGGNNEALKI